MSHGIVFEETSFLGLAKKYANINLAKISLNKN